MDLSIFYVCPIITTKYKEYLCAEWTRTLSFWCDFTVNATDNAKYVIRVTRIMKFASRTAVMASNVVLMIPVVMVPVERMSCEQSKLRTAIRRNPDTAVHIHIRMNESFQYLMGSYECI